MTEKQKQKYVTANDLCRITPDLVWYHPQFDIMGLQNLGHLSWSGVDIAEPQVTVGGIYVEQLWVHDFGLLGWVLIGDL